ncbi:unnamed protein product [Phytophthora fragariaefolia]|uniref:Unnamed protein product n=1 Tax=Phytophthora fragariaefolia TaxID=1490495 RepID=A0A9W6XXV0_9STRA|nr:unnamed protein product [Phytophthora fragariaefolia]
MSTRQAADTASAAAAPAQPPSPATAALSSAPASEPPNESIPTSAAVDGALDVSQSAAAAEPSRKGKGVGRRLTDRQRVEILDLIERSGGSLTNAEVARRYGITRAAIQKLKRKSAEVRARYRYGSAGSRDDRRRGGHVLSVPFERELYEWVRGLKARKVPVPPSLIKEKAKLLVPKYALGDFQASNGWYYNFCKRYNLETGELVEGAIALPTQAMKGDGNQPDSEAELTPDDSRQLQQIATMEAMQQQSYVQQLQQYQQQMTAMTAVTLQQQLQDQVQQQQQQQMQDHQQQPQDFIQHPQPQPQQRVQQQHDQVQAQEHQLQNSVPGNQSKSDRMVALLEQQNALLERQNNMIEDQANIIMKLFAVVTKSDTTH